MHIYAPMVEEGYEWVNCYNDDDYETFLSLNGSTIWKQWKAIRVRRVPVDLRQEGKPSDFPWLGSHVLVMRTKAVRALQALLDANGELLPLVSDDDIELYAYNARVVEALDEERSSIVRFPGTSQIMHIEKLAFVEAAIRSVDIFRLPHRASSTYVSQRFVDSVEEAGLVGLKMVRVWSSI